MKQCRFVLGERQPLRYGQSRRSDPTIHQKFHHMSVVPRLDPELQLVAKMADGHWLVVIDNDHQSMTTNHFSHELGLRNIHPNAKLNAHIRCYVNLLYDCMLKCLS